MFFLLFRPKNDKVPAPSGNLRTVPPKKRLRMKKVKVPELFLSPKWRFPLLPQILKGLLGVELGYPKPQASVGWRRGINNAPCRHWPPVLILLVDLGERSPCSLRWVQNDLRSLLNSLTIVGIHRLSENWGLNPICYYCPEKWCTAFIIEENVYWHAR